MYRYLLFTPPDPPFIFLQLAVFPGIKTFWSAHGSSVFLTSCWMWAREVFREIRWSEITAFRGVFFLALFLWRVLRLVEFSEAPSSCQSALPLTLTFSLSSISLNHSLPSPFAELMDILQNNGLHSSKYHRRRL